LASNVIVLAGQPSPASAPRDPQKQIGPLTIPNTVRSLGPAPPPMVQVLQRQLQINQQRYQQLDAYYRGDHPHSFDSLRFKRAFGKQLANFADNWMRLVVQATVNRLTVQGFRVGGADEGTSAVDGRAWAIWRANKLPRASAIAHRDAMKYGTSFVMVDPLSDRNGPAITVESPYQVVGQRDSQDRYSLINAIKKWIGDDGFQYLNYYEAGWVLKFRATALTVSAMPNDPARILQQPSWMQIDEVENPLGVVPIIPIENQPELIDGGVSDLDDLIPLNDALNKLLRDALVASEFQGFRQRWATGVDVPKDPETGKPLTDRLAQLTASERNVWMFGSTDAKVGEFGQVDLSPYATMIDLCIHHISMVSQTPSYMLVGKMANLSADAIRAAELGFVGKLWTKQADFGGPWEQAMSLALPGEAETPIETIWRDAAANSGSVLANELAIMAKLGVPQEALLERYGYSPITIARWKADGSLTPMDPDGAMQIPVAAPVGGEQQTPDG
jgi:hypothetical protein